MFKEFSSLYAFSTEKNKYIYDAFTNDFFIVDEKAYDSFVRGDKQDIRKICNQIWGRDAFQGFTFTYPFNLETIIHEANYGINQLVIEITENCSFRCEYCVYSGKYVHEREHSTNKILYKTVVLAIDDFLQHSEHVKEKRFIGFYGGEPLLEFKMIKRIIQYAKQKADGASLKFSITTNGQLLTSNKFKYMVDNDIFLYVSLDGPKKLHDRFRKDINGNGTYDQIFRNLTDLQAYDPVYYEWPALVFVSSRNESRSRLKLGSILGSKGCRSFVS